MACTVVSSPSGRAAKRTCRPPTRRTERMLNPATVRPPLPPAAALPLPRLGWAKPATSGCEAPPLPPLPLLPGLPLPPSTSPLLADSVTHPNSIQNSRRSSGWTIRPPGGSRQGAP